MAEGIPTPAWYRGVFTDDELETLRFRTRERQREALESLRSRGLSLLSIPALKFENDLKTSKTRMSGGH